jgi:Ca2+-binding EF-hand superfamily protein
MRLTVLLLLTAACLPAQASADDKKLPSPREPRPDALFKRLDADGDGKLSREELARFFDRLHQGGELARELVAAQFEKLDANKDGGIDKEELRKLPAVLLPDRFKPEELLKRFAGANGIEIDVEEIRKMFEELRGHRKLPGQSRY